MASGYLHISERNVKFVNGAYVLDPEDAPFMANKTYKIDFPNGFIASDGNAANPKEIIDPLIMNANNDSEMAGGGVTLNGQYNDIDDNSYTIKVGFTSGAALKFTYTAI